MRHTITKSTRLKLLCEIDAQQDADFVTYFAHNQAIVDVLNYSFQVNILDQLKEGFNALTEDIPRLNLPELQWYKPSEEELQRVYDSTVPVVDVELTRFLEDIKDNIDERRYTDIEEWVIAQKQFTTFMKEGEWWQRMQFITAILGTLCWIVAMSVMCMLQENDNRNNSLVTKTRRVRNYQINSNTCRSCPHAPSTT